VDLIFFVGTVTVTMSGMVRDERRPSRMNTWRCRECRAEVRGGTTDCPAPYLSARRSGKGPRHTFPASRAEVDAWRVLVTATQSDTRLRTDPPP
jgi:hypothetical protein